MVKNQILHDQIRMKLFHFQQLQETNALRISEALEGRESERLEKGGEQVSELATASPAKQSRLAVT